MGPAALTCVESTGKYASPGTHVRLGYRLRAISSIRTDGSTPIVRNPRKASSTVTWPVPHPRSRMVPPRGRPSAKASRECRSRGRSQGPGNRRS